MKPPSPVLAFSPAVLLLVAVVIISVNPCNAQAQAEERTALQAHPPQSIPGKAGTSARSGASAASAVTPSTHTFTLPPGSTLLAELSGSLKAKKLKPGDKVKAVLAQDILLRGKIVAKSESKLIGHVTEVKVRSADSPESRLGVVFEKILLKHHQQVEIAAVVQALAPPVFRRSRVDEPDQMMPPPMLSPVNSPNINPVGRGTSSSSSGGRSAGNSTSALASAAADMGAVTTVQSNPGSNPGDSVSNIRTVAASTEPITGGTGMHGVYGLKDLSLKISTTHSNPGPVIVSTKSNVKLESGTQLVLLVVNK